MRRHLLKWEGLWEEQAWERAEEFSVNKQGGMSRGNRIFQSELQVKRPELEADTQTLPADRRPKARSCVQIASRPNRFENSAGVCNAISETAAGGQDCGFLVQERGLSWSYRCE